MATFSEIAEAILAGAGADVKSTKPSAKDSATLAVEKEKAQLRALADLNEAIQKYKVEGDKRALDAWKTQYTQTYKANTEDMKARVGGLKALLSAKVRLDASQRQEAAASLRALAAASKTSSGWNSGAAALVEKWYTAAAPDKTAGGGQYVNPADSNVHQSILGSYGNPAVRPDDPRVPQVTAELLDNGFTAEDLAKADPEKFAAYKAGATTKASPEVIGHLMAASDKLAKGGDLSQGELDKLGNAIEEAAVVAAPSAEAPDLSARADTEEEKALKKERNRLLGTTVEAATAGAIGGLTNEQVGALATSPAFRRWARDHGFADADLGYRDAAGTYLMGKDTMRVLSHALTDVSGKEGRKVIGEFEGQVVDNKAAKPVEIIEGHYDDLGYLPHAWVKGEGQRIDHLDLETGTLSPARDVDGHWASAKMQKNFEVDKTNDPAGDFHRIGAVGKAALTYAGLRALRGPRGVNYAMEDLTHLPTDLLDVHPQTVHFKAPRLRARYGEDPNLEVSVQKDDGEMVRLRRKDENSPWEVIEGSLPVPDIRPEKGRVVPGSRIADAFSVLLGKKEAEPNVEDGRPRNIPRVLPQDEPPSPAVPLPVSHDRIIPFKEVLQSLFPKREKVQSESGQVRIAPKEAPVEAGATDFRTALAAIKYARAGQGKKEAEQAKAEKPAAMPEKSVEQTEPRPITYEMDEKEKAQVRAQNKAAETKQETDAEVQSKLIDLGLIPTKQPGTKEAVDKAMQRAQDKAVQAAKDSYPRNKRIAEALSLTFSPEGEAEEAAAEDKKLREDVAAMNAKKGLTPEEQAIIEPLPGEMQALSPEQRADLLRRLRTGSGRRTGLAGEAQ